MQNESNDQSQYPEVLTACNNLMKSPRLSLYEEVEIIRRKARDGKTNPGVLRQLSSDISFLIRAAFELREAHLYGVLRKCEKRRNAV